MKKKQKLELGKEQQRVYIDMYIVYTYFEYIYIYILCNYRNYVNLYKIRIIKAV